MRDVTIPVQIDHCAIHTRDWTKTSPAFFDCGFLCNGGRDTLYDPSKEQGALSYDNSGPLQLIHFFFENSYVENYCTPSGESWSEGIIDPECLAGLLMFVFDTTTPYKAVHEAKKAGYKFKLGNTAVCVSRYADHGKNKGDMICVNGIVDAPPKMPGYIMAYQRVETPELTYDNELYKHPNTAYRVDKLIVCSDDNEVYDSIKEHFPEFSRLGGRKYRHDVGVSELRLMDSEAINDVYGVSFTRNQRGHGGISFLVKDIRAVKACIEKSGRSWRISPEGLITEPIGETGVFFLFREE